MKKKKHTLNVAQTFRLTNKNKNQEAEEDWVKKNTISYDSTSW